MLGENSLKNSKTSVTTTSGVVTLMDSVSNPDAKSAAETAAKSVEGVKRVDNNLRSPGSSKSLAQTKRVVSDCWITTKVKSEILADSISKGFEVSVKTIHGVKRVDTSDLTVAGK